MENEKLFNFGNQEVPTEGKAKTKNLKFKIAAIVVIILLLLIPKFMIQDLIKERERTSKDAMSEVYEKWGGEQILVGPTLSIQCKEVRQEIIDNKHKNILREITYDLLPNTLSFNGEVNTESKHRGIYKIVTFRGPIEVKGTFTFTEEEWDKLNKCAINGKVKINFGLSDLKGICDETKITLGGKVYTLEPDGNGICSGTSQLSAVIDTQEWAELQEIPFSMNITLRGSQSLQFTPVGKSTTVRLSSDCQTPSFCGNFLPSDSSDSTKAGKGFSRKWKVSYLNRNYPQFYDRSEETYSYEISKSAFGVNLLVPVGHYQKSLRCVKYAILFIVLTLAVFFFIEMIHKKNIHPVQYALVGLALTLFYSLLLSFSEHIGFTPAYLVSTGMTVALLTVYTSAVLKIRKTAFYIGGALLLLYSYIFVLIQMESYALLAGSLGLFVILAFFMYLSQKIEWNKEQ